MVGYISLEKVELIAKPTAKFCFLVYRLSLDTSHGSNIKISRLPTYVCIALIRPTYLSYRISGCRKWISLVAIHLEIKLHGPYIFPFDIRLQLLRTLL